MAENSEQDQSNVNKRSPSRDYYADLEKDPLFERPTQSKLSSRFSCGSCTFILFCTIGTILLTALILSQRPDNSLEVYEWPEVQGGSHVVAHCGKTPDEAREIGCVWDIMNFAWYVFFRLERLLGLVSRIGILRF